MTTNRQLNIGILGTAMIARAFCAGVALSKSVAVTTVASRDRDKAKQFAESCGLPRYSQSYEALLADPQVQAVYIPLPNSLHVEWSIRAARAGKHVLCEKPLASTGDQARAVFEAAHEERVIVVEGYPYLAQQQTQKMRELIAAGEIGQVRYIQANFSFTLDKQDDVRWEPKLAGGALMDVGCYPVSLVRMIAGSVPIRVMAFADWHPDGVDRALAGTLEFSTGMRAQIACGFDAVLDKQALIVGTKGAIHTTFFNHPSKGAPPVLHIKRGSGKDAAFETIAVPSTNGFLAESESFARLINEGGSQSWSGATPPESIDIAVILEALIASAHSGAPVKC